MLRPIAFAVLVMIIVVSAAAVPSMSAAAFAPTQSSGGVTIARPPLPAFPSIHDAQPKPQTSPGVPPQTTPRVTPSPTPRGTATAPSGTAAPPANITQVTEYNLSLPFKSLSDTIVKLIFSFSEGSFKAGFSIIKPPMDLAYGMVTSKPMIIAMGSQQGNYPIFGNFTSIPANCDNPSSSSATFNILECYMVRGWLATRNVSLFLLPITLMLTVGAAMRNASTSVTGYADAREALINWFLSVAEMLVSLWAIGMALGLLYAISNAFAGFFPELASATMGTAMEDTYSRLLATLQTDGLYHDNIAMFAGFLSYLFAFVMVVVTMVSVIFSILAQNILLTLLVIISPFIICVCTIGPLRWFQGLWWKAIAFCLILAPINRILMSGAILILLTQTENNLALVIFSLLVAVGFISIMLTLNFAVVKVIFGSAMEVGNKFMGTVMGMFDLVASMAGLAVAGPLGGAVGGALGQGAAGVAGGLTPSGGGSTPSLSGPEMEARNRVRGAEAMSAVGSTLQRTRIPGLSGLGAGLAAGGRAESRSASMDEIFQRDVRNQLQRHGEQQQRDADRKAEKEQDHLRRTTYQPPPPHVMPDAPAKSTGADTIARGSSGRVSRDYAASESLGIRSMDSSQLPSTPEEIQSLKMKSVQQSLTQSEPHLSAMLDNVRSRDPDFSNFAGELGAGRHGFSFSDVVGRTHARIAGISDPIYDLSPQYSGKEISAWFDPNVNSYDRIHAAAITYNLNVPSITPSADLNEQVASSIRNMRLSNQDWVMPDRETGSRGWDRVIEDSANRKLSDYLPKG